MFSNKIFNLILLLNFISLILTGHFYSGSITWKVVNSNPDDTIDILLDYKTYWRSDPNVRGTERCTDAKISNKSLIGENEKIGCDVGCEPLTFSISSKVYCNSYSLANNWSYGKRSELIKVLNNQTYIEASFITASWLRFQYGMGFFKFIFKMNLTERSDMEKINTPPICLNIPLPKIKVNCNSTIKIPVFDSDGDKVECRFSIDFECGGVCAALPDSVLDSEKCILYFKPSSTGYYGVAMQIEDFSDLISTSSPLSSIPVHFIINVENKPCVTTSIYFHYLTLSEDSCIALNVNQVLSEKLIFYSESPVIEITLISPDGFTKSSIENYNNNSSLWYVNITWTPSQIGVQMFCFQGFNDLGDSTEQRCVKLIIGTLSPVVSCPVTSTTTISTINISTKQTTQNSLILMTTSTNETNNKEWLTILSIVIGIVAFILLSVALFLSFLLGYMRRMKKIIPLDKNNKPVKIECKQNEDLKSSNENDGLRKKRKFYIKRSRENGSQCVILED